MQEGYVAQAYHTSGWSILTIATILAWAILGTSLWEEIFFRGFLTKRISHAFGWKTGVTIQAILFGAIHTIGLWDYGPLPAILTWITTAIIGWALGWLCMRKADESILHGWMIHAGLNIISPIFMILIAL